MIGSKSIKLGMRLAKREWRSGELRLLMIALFIAVTSLATIGLFIERIGLGMERQAANFLGADRSIGSRYEIDNKWIDKAESLGLDMSQTTGLSSVVFANNNLQLSSINAVDENFPLRGQVVIAQAAFDEGEVKIGGPKTGEVWAEQKLIQVLGIKVGDQVNIGYSQFTLSGVIVDEPGKGQEVFNTQPSVMMNLQDLEATKLIQPGSRVGYYLLIAGTIEAIQQFDEYADAELKDNENYRGGKQSSQSLGNAIDRADQYLGLANVVTILLSAITIAMVSVSYGRKQINNAALFRCLGLAQNELMGVYLSKFILLGGIAICFGLLVGIGLQDVLIMLMSDILPKEIPAASHTPLLVAACSGFLVLFGVCLPMFWRLKNTPPMQVIQNVVATLTMKNNWVRLLTLIILGGVIFWQVPNWKLVSGMLAGLGVSAIVLGILSVVLLWKLSKFPFKAAASKFAVRNLTRNKIATSAQLIAFSGTLALMLLVLILRTDLLTAWKQQLPDDAPNRFLVNIQESEVEPINQFMQEQNLKAPEFYPMVRGRLVGRNGKPIKETLPERAQEDNALRRELNLTWVDAVPEGNQLLEGKWFTSGVNHNQVSVESGLATRLEIKIGDELEYDLAGVPIKARVTSIRKVEWDSFRPNFYMIFQPGAIDTESANYITSFYIDANDLQILPQFVEQFPTVTVIDVDAVMQQVRVILQQVTMAVEYILIFVLTAGLAVLYAITLSSVDVRNKTAAIVRTLGASRTVLQNSLVFEFVTLGLLGGIVAAVATESIAWGLYEKVFKLEAEFHGWMWIASPTICVTLVTLLGVYTCRHVVKVPPLQILRNEF